MNKDIIAIVGLLLIVLCLVFINPTEEVANPGNHTVLNVSKSGPVSVYAAVNEIKTQEYYAGYDNETVAWMQSLGGKHVFYSEDAIVIMDSVDARKIPSKWLFDITDVSFTEIFECNVLENHSLGDFNHSKDVLLVNNVTFIGENISYYDV